LYGLGRELEGIAKEINDRKMGGVFAIWNPHEEGKI